MGQAIMVSRYTTPPIEVPERADSFTRADLIFYGIDHSKASFEGRIFLNDPDADEAKEIGAETYAGSFWIFGHGGCFGDIGHCDVPVATDPYDLRPPLQLTPADRVVTVTESVQRLVEADQKEVTVTVIAHPAEGESSELLAFDKVRLATYVGEADRT